MDIIFEVSGQWLLPRSIIPKLVRNTVEQYTLRFILDESWPSRAAVSVVFTDSGNESCEVLIKDGCAIIPAQVLTDCGCVDAAVKGSYNNRVYRTQPFHFYVVESSADENTDAFTPALALQVQELAQNTFAIVEGLGDSIEAQKRADTAVLSAEQFTQSAFREAESARDAAARAGVSAETACSAQLLAGQAAVEAKSAEESADASADRAEAVAQSMEADKNRLSAAVGMINGLIVNPKACGKTIRLTDSADYPVQEVHIYGRTTQDGEPTPENPVNLASIENPVLTVCGENIFNTINVMNAFISNAKISASSQGRIIYAECEPDTTYTISKQRTARFIYGYTTNKPVSGGKVLSETTDNNADAVTITTGADAKYICAYVWVDTADTVPWEDILKTIRIDIGDVVQYQTYTANGVALRGIGDVRDELIVYADGTGKLVQRITSETFDGSSDEKWIVSMTDGSPNGQKSVLLGAKTIVDNSATTTNRVCCMCDQYAVQYNYAGNSVFLTNDRLTFGFGTGKLDNTEWNSRLQNNPITVVYGVANPVVTEYTAEEMSAILPKLSTYYGTTNIFTNADAELSVTYVADTKSYIDNKFNELATALIAQIEEG